jgi:hypothetical protein
VTLYQGTVRSGRLLAPGATLVTDISVQGAHSIDLNDLTVSIQSVTQSF